MSLLRNIGIGRTKLINIWMEKYVSILRGTYKINDDYTIDADGDVCPNKLIPNMPDYIQFNKVDGWFNMNRCERITSLRGCPKECGTFSCSDCKNLTSLEGAPEIVRRIFNCSRCWKLESLEHCPKSANIFYAELCGKKFTEKYVRSLCDVKIRIEV